MFPSDAFSKLVGFTLARVSTWQEMLGIEYEDEFEYEYDWGTIARKGKRAGEDPIFSPSDVEQSFSFFNRTRTRFLSA